MSSFGALTELPAQRDFSSTPAAASDLFGRMGSWFMPMASRISGGAAGAGPIGLAGYLGSRILTNATDKMHQAWIEEDEAAARGTEAGRAALARLVLMNPSIRAKVMHQKPFQRAMINAGQDVGGKPIWMASRENISPIELAKHLGVTQQDIAGVYNPDSPNLDPGIRRAIQLQQLKQDLKQGIGQAGEWISKNKVPVGIGLAATAMSVPALMALRDRLSSKRKKGKKVSNE